MCLESRYICFIFFYVICIIIYYFVMLNMDLNIGDGDVFFVLMLGVILIWY